jgi:hypothetical protein
MTEITYDVGFNPLHEPAVPLSVTCLSVDLRNDFLVRRCTHVACAVGKASVNTMRNS